VPYRAGQATADASHAANAAATPRLSAIEDDLFKLTQIEQFLGVPLPEDVQEFGSEDVRFLDGPALEALLLERPPFFFIDRAVAFGGTSVLAVARMTTERSGGHFPGRPIVPLIELCKGMAQAGIILVALHARPEEAPIAIGSGPSKALARELIKAPADVLIKVTLDTSRLKLHFVSGSAYVGGAKIGTLTNIVYTLIPRTQLIG
jgi:3-hydroxymyristoyl/3-hydroxydecanoyl-(acyl carrier protein) dehydratase